MSLLDHYLATADRYDELLGSDGMPRPHWRALMGHLTKTGPRGMVDARETLQRQIVHVPSVDIHTENVQRGKTARVQLR